MASRRRAAENSGPAASSAEGDLEAFGVNAALVEEIRQRYEVDPGSVHSSWGTVFGEGDDADSPAPGAPRSSAEDAELADRHARVLRLIHA